MSLLTLFEYEIMCMGGIANVYNKASEELSQFEKCDTVLPLYSRHTCKIMNLTTGKIYKNCSVAARSIDARPDYFQKRIKKFGRYLTFIKVA